MTIIGIAGGTGSGKTTTQEKDSRGIATALCGCAAARLVL